MYRSSSTSKYEFSIARAEDAVSITRHLHRSQEMAEIVHQEPVTEVTEVIKCDTRYAAGSLDSRPASLRCGDFKGTFYYAPRSEKRFKSLGIPSGVFLYRDGMRVDPYGHVDDDWLGARARKAARQGYAAIQPNLLTGYVEISKVRNPELIDMSNRQGLVENDAYDDFWVHARAEFREFEKLVFEEYVEPNWEAPEDKLQRAAQRAQGFGVANLRALVHSLRQPVAGLGLEMHYMEHLLRTHEIPEPLKSKFTATQQRAEEHLRAIDQAIGRFFDSDLAPQAELFRLDDALSEAVERVTPLARTRGVNIEFAGIPDHNVIAPKAHVIEAIQVLVCNGIEVARPEGRSSHWVHVSATAQSGGYEIVVSDNGVGIDPAVKGSLFTSGTSTKGRPTGVGLTNAKELLALFRAEMSLVKTDEQGSTFRILIPGWGVERGKPNGR